MKTKQSAQHTWYEANMGNDHQGLVIDEQTGANIAVTYDRADARLIAAAPELLESCNYIDSVAPLDDIIDEDVLTITITGKALKDLRYAIAKALNP